MSKQLSELKESKRYKIISLHSLIEEAPILKDFIAGRSGIKTSELEDILNHIDSCDLLSGYGFLSVIPGPELLFVFQLKVK